jgi:hypothetical protein
MARWNSSSAVAPSGAATGAFEAATQREWLRSITASSSSSLSLKCQ